MKSLVERYGKWAVVTGASSGIGRAFAPQLASQGFNLLLTARRLPLLESLQQELKIFPVEVQLFEADLSNADDVERLITAAQACEPGLLVSNAGFGLKGEFVRHDAGQLQNMYMANSIHPAQLIHALLPGMLSRKQGGIIVTGSIEGEAPFPYSAGYAASKAFLHGLVQS